GARGRARRAGRGGRPVGHLPRRGCQGRAHVRRRDRRRRGREASARGGGGNRGPGGPAMNALRQLAKSGWGPGDAVGAIAMGAVGVLATREAWADIYAIGMTDEESSHIFLVPIVVAWIAWVRRLRLRHCPPRGMMIGPAIAAAGWLLYWYGFNHATQ